MSLPHHVEAERSILGAILLYGAPMLAEVASVVRDDDFHDQAAAAVYRAMLRISRRGEGIDVVSLEAELAAAGDLRLAGGLEALGRIGDKYTAAQNAVGHARRVRDLAYARRFVLACADIVGDGESALANPAGWLGQVEGRLIGLLSRPAATSVQPLHHHLGTVWERLKRTMKGEQLPAISSGFADVDRYLDGGFEPGTYVVVGARPSMGKTALGLNILLHNCIVDNAHWFLSADKRPRMQPGFLFSAEMAGLPIARRAGAHLAGVSMGKLKTGRDDSGGITPEETSRFFSIISRTEAADVLVDDGGGMHIDEIVARVHAWRMHRDRFPEGDEAQIGIVVVDYIQILRAPSQILVREQQVSYISSALKNLAKNTGVVVLALCQLNRAVEGREDHRPDISDLRESGATEQDADVILFPFRPERYLAKDASPADVQRAKHGAEIIIGKARNAQTGVVPVYWDGPTQTFDDLERRRRS